MCSEMMYASEQGKHTHPNLHFKLIKPVKKRTSKVHFNAYPRIIKCYCHQTKLD